MKATNMFRIALGAACGLMIGKAFFSVEKQCAKDKIKSKIIKILD